jgi:NAD(P)-dependent dehydrogenase (short-subunit alcohol dehydrogenase family)
MGSYKLEDIKSQNGKVAIVTGANDGLGLETTRFFVSKDIQVVMACRNLEKANLAMQSIKEKNPKAKLSIIHLDLSSLNSVHNFVDTFNSQHDRLDLLVNNAGIMIPPFSLTEDGFESQMGVNYFSHFLLTGLLIDLLKSTPNSRVVSLSSIAHKSGKIDFDNINSKGKYNKVAAYSQSKLACLIFAKELDRRLRKCNSTTLSVAAHPGVSATNLFQFLPTWFKVVSPILEPIFSHPPQKAAQSIIVAALHESISGGDYIGPSGFNEMKGSPGKAKSAKLANAQKVAKKLWSISEKLTDNTFNI